MTTPASRTRGVVIGVVSAALVGLVAYGATRPSASPPAAATPAPAPPPSHSAEAWPPPPDPPPVNDDAGDWTLPPPARETGLLVASGGTRLRVLDVDSGRTSVVPGIDGPMVDVVAAIDGGWLAFRRDQCVDDLCDAEPLYAVRDGRATLVGRAHAARPDPDGRTVWLTAFPDGATSADKAAATLERRTFDGRVLGRRRLRAGERLLAVGPDGPLVGTGRAAVTLVDARSYERVPVLEQAYVLGMAGGRVVWADFQCYLAPASGRCTVRTTEPRTGVSADVVRLPGLIWHAAVDPRGTRVAIAFDGGHEGASVRSYDLSTGRAEDVGGMTYPPRVGSLTWSPDGRWLVLTNEHEMAVWAPGDATAYATADPPADTPVVGLS